MAAAASVTPNTMRRTPVGLIIRDMATLPVVAGRNGCAARVAELCLRHLGALVSLARDRSSIAPGCPVLVNGRCATTPCRPVGDKASGFFCSIRPGTICALQVGRTLCRYDSAAP